MGIIRAAQRSIAPPSFEDGFQHMPTEIAGPPIAHPEIIEVDSDKIGCDGGGGALGHPLVYLTMTASGQVECPYCSRLYVRRGGAGAGGGH